MWWCKSVFMISLLIFGSGGASAQKLSFLKEGSSALKRNTVNILGATFIFCSGIGIMGCGTIAGLDKSVQDHANYLREAVEGSKDYAGQQFVFIHRGVTYDAGFEIAEYGQLAIEITDKESGLMLPNIRLIPDHHHVDEKVHIFYDGKHRNASILGVFSNETWTDEFVRRGDYYTFEGDLALRGDFYMLELHQHPYVSHDGEVKLMSSEIVLVNEYLPDSAGGFSDSFKGMMTRQLVNMVEAEYNN